MFRIAKVVLLAAAVCVVINTGSASAQPVAIGVTGGATLGTADVEPEGTFAYSRRTDWFAGATVFVAPDAPIGLQVEALYSRRGTNFETRVTGSLDGAYRNAFLDIPVLVRLRALPWSSGGLFVLAGPTIGFSLSAEVEQLGRETDQSDRFESYEAGLATGLALESDGFIIGARYTHGLTNFANGSHPALQEWKHRTIAITFGAKF